MVSLAPKGQYDFLNPQIKQIGEGHPGDEDYFDPEGEEAQQAANAGCNTNAPACDPKKAHETDGD